MFWDTRGTLDTPISPTPDTLDTYVSPPYAASSLPPPSAPQSTHPIHSSSFSDCVSPPYAASPLPPPSAPQSTHPIHSSSFSDCVNGLRPAHGLSSSSSSSCSKPMLRNFPWKKEVFDDCYKLCMQEFDFKQRNPYTVPVSNDI